jgi:hypothetical protein
LYFLGPNVVGIFDLVYGGSETHDPRVAPLIWTQEHGPLHGWVALQRPLQTPTTPALLCSCRAETVPAHKAAIMVTARNVDLTFLLMVALLSVPG